MMKIFLELEDVALEATRNDKKRLWVGHCVGKSFKAEEAPCEQVDFEMTDAQISAVSFLALYDENADGGLKIATLMYEIAETAVVGWPVECRPFP